MLVPVPEESRAIVFTNYDRSLQRTNGTHGNTMLLVLFDRFSEWVKLVLQRKTTTKVVVKASRERILARFGTPNVLLSDNGSQFAARYWEDIC